MSNRKQIEAVREYEELDTTTLTESQRETLMRSIDEYISLSDYLKTKNTPSPPKREDDLTGYYKMGEIKVIRKEGRLLHIQAYINPQGNVKYQTVA